MSLFSWLGNMVVLKPSLVSALSLFLCVIKTNKPWDQTETGSGRRRDLSILQPSSVGESKREPVSWTVENNHPLHITSSHHFTLTEQHANTTVHSKRCNSLKISGVRKISFHFSIWTKRTPPTKNLPGFEPD